MRCRWDGLVLVFSVFLIVGGGWGGGTHENARRRKGVMIFIVDGLFRWGLIGGGLIEMG